MKFVSFIALPLLFLGCKPEEKSKFTPVTSLFTANDLEPGTVNIISADEIGEAMAMQSKLWANSSATALMDSASCMSAKLDSLPLKADKANLSLVAVLDASECFDSAELGLNVTSAPIRFALWMGCQNEDLEDLNGKAFGDLGDGAALKCAEESEQQTIINMEFKIVANGLVKTESGTETEVDYTYRSITATQTTEGGPCSLTSVGDSWLWANGCVTISKQDVTQMNVGGKPVPEEMTADFLLLNYQNIMESKDSNAPFYESGTFDMTLNNWSGSVTYTGPGTAPSWIMKNADEEKSGTLGLVPLKVAKLLPWARSGSRPQAQALHH